MRKLFKRNKFKQYMPALTSLRRYELSELDLIQFEVAFASGKGVMCWAAGAEFSSDREVELTIIERMNKRTPQYGLLNRYIDYRGNVYDHVIPIYNNTEFFNAFTITTDQSVYEDMNEMSVYPTFSITREAQMVDEIDVDYLMSLSNNLLNRLITDIENVPAPEGFTDEEFFDQKVHFLFISYLSMIRLLAKIEMDENFFTTIKRHIATYTDNEKRPKGQYLTLNKPFNAFTYAPFLDNL